jgi:hypothetical protein
MTGPEAATMVPVLHDLLPTRKLGRAGKLYGSHDVMCTYLLSVLSSGQIASQDDM